MDILKMLAQLRAERQQIEETITAIERLAAGSRGKRRGRPPKWMSAIHAAEALAASAPLKKRAVSASARKTTSETRKKRRVEKKTPVKPTES